MARDTPHRDRAREDITVELLGPLAEQLPVAVLFLLAAAAVARYAARLLDKLFAAQERIQAQLIDALERNTAAWRDACAALASLEAAVVEQAGRAPRRPARLRTTPREGELRTA